MIRPSDHWPLDLDENFTGTDLNHQIWSFETEDKTGQGWGNWETQTYTDSPENARILDGILSVNLLRHGDQWTSARLTTQGKYTFTFGRVDVCLRTTRRNGPWPAVWALSSRCGVEQSWPLCGEIDLFEMQTTWHYIPSSLHFQQRHADSAVSFHNHDVDTDRWRIFSMEWTPDYIAFFHDNHQVGRYDKPNLVPASDTNWPYTEHNKFHLIINNAMQPRPWGTAPDPDMTQHSLQVQYIKTWRYPH